MAFVHRLVAALALLSSTEAKTFFQEKFEDGWEKRWVESTTWKSAGEMGKWKHTAGKYYGDENDKGIQTSQDAKFYGLSALMDEPFTQTGDLVIQYTVKDEAKTDCAGMYIKLASKSDQASFGGDTPYQIMFGPDICGSKKTHVIFNNGDKNLEYKQSISPPYDDKSHMYTLHLKADGTFEVFIDEVSKKSGSLEEGWDFLLPKEIKDPDMSKPEDWVDEKKIPDPDDVKPEGYDDIPAKIPDPDASKPDDWEDEDDGEWEPPSIDNPDYKGPWRQKKIDNPDYKGPWEHPMIPNPDYKEDPNLAVRCTDCGMVGFELWQVKSGSVFDDIIVTDSLEEAKAFAQETFFKKRDGEKEMEKAAKQKEEDAKKAAEESEDEDEHDEL